MLGNAIAGFHGGAVLLGNVMADALQWWHSRWGWVADGGGVSLGNAIAGFHGGAVLLGNVMAGGQWWHCRWGWNADGGAVLLGNAIAGFHGGAVLLGNVMAGGQTRCNGGIAGGAGMRMVALGFWGMHWQVPKSIVTVASRYSIGFLVSDCRAV